jgi:D-alanyl-lipoteichoic acid acyltransferase DltB (MBOAT superfamily)
MVFNSLTFLIFLAVVLPLYYRLGHRGQNIMLVLASYVFYGWWDYRFLALLIFTTLFDFACALQMDGETRPGRRKRWLAASITANMTVLGIFKYYDFFASSLQSALAPLGIHPSFPMLHVILPLGISFYTFLSMSYTIDVYRRELKATRHPLDFMLYVAYFPHLVAGPIVRASFLLPQCQRPRVIQPVEVQNGLWLILMGYVKKVVIADRLGQIVDWGFAQPSPPFPNLNAWIVIYAFAFQIYGDFAGYSDIARGLAKIMGFELTVNFRAPYLVTNPAAFWRNWHISLSTWLRDYLYIPLGGNRQGLWQTYRNLMLTMLLGGLWHGAGFAFILWGFYHGVLLSIHRWWGQFRGGDKPAAPAGTAPLLGRMKQLALIVLFFHITCVGWLFFRAGGLHHGVSQWAVVKSWLHAMINLPGTRSLSGFLVPVALLGGLALFFQWKNDRMNGFSQWQESSKGVAICAALAAITLLGVFEGAQFIYFQF